MERLPLYPVFEPKETTEYELINLVTSSSESDSEKNEEWRCAALHSELVEFASRCLPRRSDGDATTSVLYKVHEAAQTLLPNCTASIFGSKATGLSLPSSDVDIVLLQTPFDIYAPRQEFTTAQRAAIMAKLSALKSRLHASARSCGKLIPAKVPILRLEIPVRGKLLKVDISIGVRNAIEAVSFIRRHIIANPVVIPLFLVLKSMLKEWRLNEVYQGGISSYALFNMVLAHLMMENCHKTPSTEIHQTSVYDEAFLKDLLSNEIKLPLDRLLMSFLKRFGHWNRSRAVSIRSADGTMDTSDLRNAIHGRTLHVEDPQAPGCDASRKSFEMPRILTLFRETAEKLELSDHEDAKLSSFPYLSQIIDCDQVLKIQERTRSYKRQRSSPIEDRRRRRQKKKAQKDK